MTFTLFNGTSIGFIKRDQSDVGKVFDGRCDLAAGDDCWKHDELVGRPGLVQHNEIGVDRGCVAEHDTDADRGREFCALGLNKTPKATSSKSALVRD